MLEQIYLRLILVAVATYVGYDIYKMTKFSWLVILPFESIVALFLKIMAITIGPEHIFVQHLLTVVDVLHLVSYLVIWRSIKNIIRR